MNCNQAAKGGRCDLRGHHLLPDPGVAGAAEDGSCCPGYAGWTDIFIYPGYRFKAHGLLLSPIFTCRRATLVMLVSAFAGREHVLAAYKEAVRERYRFFSLRGCDVYWLKDAQNVRRSKKCLENQAFRPSRHSLSSTELAKIKGSCLHSLTDVYEIAQNLYADSIVYCRIKAQSRAWPWAFFILLAR